MQDLVNGRAPVSPPLESVHKGVRGFNPENCLQFTLLYVTFGAFLGLKNLIFMEGPFCGDQADFPGVGHAIEAGGWESETGGFTAPPPRQIGPWFDA